MAVSPGERKVLDHLGQLFAEAAAAKGDVTKNWNRYLNFYQGRQWERGRPSHKNDIVINLIELIVERNKGLLTDTRPAINVLARHRGLENVAKVLQKTIQAIWEEQNMEQTLQEQIGLSSIFGSVAGGASFDPLADSGYGEIVLPVIDPRTLYMDPGVTRARDLEKGQYAITESVLPVDVIRERWEERGRLVQPDEGVSTFDPGISGIASAAIRTGPHPLPRRRSRIRPSVTPRAIVREYWIKDPSVNEGAEATTMGKRIIERGQKLFPGGRHIIATREVILVDEPNPFYDARFPLDMMDWRMDVDSPWGRSEVAALINPQRNLNKMASLLMENAAKMNNAWVIADADALTPKQWDEVTDAPGLIIKKKPQREFRRDVPQALPGTYFQVISLLISIIEQLSGLTDVTQGRAGRVTSGIAIESLQIASQVLVRMRARTLESFLTRQFQKVIARIFQFYTKNRLFHITGPGAEIEEFEFKRDDLLRNIEDPKLAFRDFKFSITPGSTLAITRVQRGLLAGQLFSLGVIDDEAMLEAVEWPNREQVLERTKQKQAQGLLPGRTGRRGRFRQRGTATRPTGQPASQLGGVSALAGTPGAVGGGAP